MRLESSESTDVAKEPVSCMLCSLDEYRQHVGQTQSPSLATIYRSSIDESDKVDRFLYRLMFSRL